MKVGLTQAKSDGVIRMNRFLIEQNPEAARNFLE